MPTDSRRVNELQTDEESPVESSEERTLVELPDGSPSLETSAFWDDASLDTGVAPADAIRVGAAEVFPGISPPLTWTIAAPALEYGLRIALCSGLGLLAWPSLGAEWALVGRLSGRAVLRRSLFTATEEAIARHPRRVLLRASRLRRVAAQQGARVGSMTAAMRAGRLQSETASRTDDDLLLTLSRLRELAFSIWGHLSEVSLTDAIGRGERDAEALAATVATAGAVPLWGTSGDRREATVGAQDLRSLADSLRMALTEMRILADVLGERLAGDGVLERPEDIAYTTWNELPVLLGSPSVRSGAADRLGLRRLQHQRLHAAAE